MDAAAVVTPAVNAVTALSLTWLDWALLAVLALSLVVGLVRGFVFECLSLLGWVAAWFAAQWAAPQLAPHLPVGGIGTPLNHSLALVLTFVAALIAWALLARLVRMLIHATPLSVLDRLLGAGFGVLRGLVVLLALASVVAMSPAVNSDTWQDSQGARVLTKSLQTLKPLLPESAARLLPQPAQRLLPSKPSPQ